MLCLAFGATVLMTLWLGFFPATLCVAEAHVSANDEFDCDAAYANREAAWSETKKAWCCQSHAKGCPEEDFDCDAAYGNWKSSWSETKKVWCCENHNKGCLFDCQDGSNQWAAAWSNEKKLWCCENKAVGCPRISTTSAPYDCQVGYWNRHLWPQEQKDWCCSHKQLGCFFPTTTVPTTTVPTTKTLLTMTLVLTSTAAPMAITVPKTTAPSATTAVSSSTTVPATGAGTATAVTSASAAASISVPNVTVIQDPATTSMIATTAAPHTSPQQSTALITPSTRNTMPTHLGGSETEASTRSTSEVAISTTGPSKTASSVGERRARTTTSAEGLATTPSTATDAPGDSATECFEDRSTWEPLDMPRTAAVHEPDAAACQKRCAKTVGCVHFSYWWIGRNCHLQDAYAVQQFGRLGFVTGPFQCWDSLDQSQYVRKAHNTFVHKSYRCVELGTLYTPLMGLAKHIPKTEAAGREAIKECREYCASVQGCAHFTIQFPERLCRLAGADAHRVQPYMNAVSGPPACDRGEPDTAGPAAAAVQGSALAVVRKAALPRALPVPSGGAGRAWLSVAVATGLLAAAATARGAGLVLRRAGGASARRPRPGGSYAVPAACDALVASRAAE